MMMARALTISNKIPPTAKNNVVLVFPESLPIFLLGEGLIIFTPLQATYSKTLFCWISAKIFKKPQFDKNPRALNVILPLLSTGFLSKTLLKGDWVTAIVLISSPYTCVEFST